MSLPAAQMPGRIPHSQSLVASFERAEQAARQQGHRHVTNEHLLLALIDDPEVAPVLLASQIEPERLRTEVMVFLGSLPDRLLPGEQSTPQPHPDLVRMLEYASAAASQSRRPSVTGAIVLAAIVGDGKTQAAGILRSQGLSFEVAIQALRSITTTAPAAPTASPQPVSVARPVPAPAERALPPAGAPPPQVSATPVSHAPSAPAPAAHSPPPAAEVAPHHRQGVPSRQPQPMATPLPMPTPPAQAERPRIEAQQATAPRPAVPHPAATQPAATQNVTPLPARETADRLADGPAHDEPPPWTASEPAVAPSDAPARAAAQEMAAPPADDRRLAETQPRPTPQPTPRPPAEAAHPVAATPVEPTPTPRTPPPQRPAPQPPADDVDAILASIRAQRTALQSQPRPAAAATPSRPAAGEAAPTATPAGRERRPEPEQWRYEQRNRQLQPTLDMPAGMPAREPAGPDLRDPDLRNPEPHARPQLGSPPPAPAPAPRLRPATSRSRAEPTGSPGGQLQAPPRGSTPVATPAARESKAAANIDAGQLVENIPRRMRVGVAEVVEVRIARDRIDGLDAGMQGRGRAHRHDLVVTKAMAVRLRAPEGEFWIEPASPETQWVENALGLLHDEFATWRWTVTPKRRGTGKLVLIVSARTIDQEGLAAETALPDQKIEVRVRTNYGRTIRRMLGWVLLVVLGGVLGKFGEGIWSLAANVVAPWLR